MTDRNELNNLIAKARNAGATVTVDLDSTGCPLRIAVAGLKSVGSHPMAPISFAERMREVLL